MGDILHPFIFSVKPIFSETELYFFITNILKPITIIVSIVYSSIDGINR